MSISKELLSEVLGCKVHHINIEVHESTVVYHTVNPRYKDYPQPKTINIHELMHLCKEWAFNNKKEVTSGLMAATVFYQVFDTHYEVWRSVDKEFEAPTEPEAVFKCCQWILENKDN